jgi:signal transduction histidine kinase
MHQSYHPDVAAVQRIASIPSILATVAQITGLRFVCIARVTADSWTACAVLDELGLGIAPHDTLDVDTTLCAQVRGSGQAVVIDHASEDAVYRTRPVATPHAFESCISVPIRRQNGDYFGTLCGIDQAPKNLTGTPALASMTLFAELISQQLSSQQELEETQVALLDARATAELREQFIAVLGHDLRNPLGTIITGTELMMLSLGNEKRLTILANLVIGSGKRMAALVDDMVDLTQGKLGGGIPLQVRHESDLRASLHQVVEEMRSTYPQRQILLVAGDIGSVLCDARRIAQLTSNLLKNALVYGDPDRPVSVAAHTVGDMFELSVTNHGPRMSEDTVAHLFQPYWRAAAKSPHEGLGLGLFIVSEIARSHGGEMTVMSSDEHTTFLFKLPCKQDAAVAA